MSETKGKHTPTPWEYRVADIGDEDFIFVPQEIIGADGFKVVAVEGGLANTNQSWNKDDLYANAQLIVRAVNPHEQLVAALRAMLKAYKQLMPGIAHIAVQDYANINEAPIMARDALRAAGEDVE